MANFFLLFFVFSNAGEKVKRIVNYMFHQALFYPLNPPLHDLCVDSGLLAKFANLEKIPNLLIVPSDMKYFARVSWIYL